MWGIIASLNTKLVVNSTYLSERQHDDVFLQSATFILHNKVYMPLAVLTSVFNCVKNSLRHRHYQTFKDNLGDIPLYVVELAFDDYPFVLSPEDVFSCPKAAEPGMLRNCQVGQLFNNCHHSHDQAKLDRGISNRDKGIVHTGYAWAAKRSFLEKHGLFDRSIIGGNDVLMTAAYCGWKKHPYFRHLTPKFMNFYSKWATKVLEDTGGAVGYIGSDITHLWHGYKVDRNYIGRIKLMNDLNPETDIEIDEAGCWKWITNKPDLHKGVEDYMRSRIRG